MNAPAQALHAFWKTYGSTIRKHDSLSRSLADGAPDWRLLPSAANIREEKINAYRKALADAAAEKETPLALLCPAHGGEYSLAEALEVLALLAKERPCAALRAAYHSFAAARVLEKFGTTTQKKALSSGKLIAFSLTEPDTGSDASALKTVLRESGGGFSLSGKKFLVTNIASAGHFLIVAKRGDTADAPLVVVLLERDRPGLRVNSETDEILLDAIRIESGDFVGGAENGYEVVQAAMDGLRLAVAAVAVSWAETLLERAALRVKSRTQFGKTLAENEVVREKLAGCGEELAAAQALILCAAECENPSAEAAAAKIAATEAAQRTGDECAKLLGGGAHFDSSLQATLKRIRSLYFTGGANDLLRLFLALYAGKPVAQLIIDMEKSRKNPLSWLDVKASEIRHAVRFCVAPPALWPLSSPLKPAGAVLRDILAILADRFWIVFRHYENTAAEHGYEMKRLADMLIDALLLAASLRNAEDSPGGDAAAWPLHRANRAWLRVTQASRELFLSDEGNVEVLASSVLGEVPEDGR